MLSNAMRNGLISGLLTVGLYLSVYLIDKDGLLSLWLYWGSLTVVVVFMAMTARREVRDASRELLWKDLIRSPFLVFVVCNCIFWVFYYLLFTFDAQLPDIAMNRQQEALEEMRQWMGDQMTADDYKRSRKEIETAQGLFSLGDLAFSYAKGLLGGFLLSLSLALWARNTRSDRELPLKK